ncbi:helix-turn-helix transcriptional regulator [uncultured Tenacibaculum sp.]|uniref:helix-turn-helix domain-containing protein n=1 Tax=uncultured Tenacibaculum sp. TaxID=174713 RepID=UPI002621518A|nr:helix-turn-helix transcriptional regulator [uncultured Tenacibaculum sp.]
MKKLVSQRFIEAVNYILSENTEVKKGEIAKKLNLSNSSFSEILNKRMNPSIEAISLISINYNISLYWLINNNGDMLNSEGEKISGEYSIEATVRNQERQIDQLYRVLEILATKLDISKDSLYKLAGKL